VLCLLTVKSASRKTRVKIRRDYEVGLWRTAAHDATDDWSVP
jgi:hypothetical protein